ncbi:MAG: hypothetical protein ACO1SV_25110 [Fimbriimonas sp.]
MSTEPVYAEWHPRRIVVSPFAWLATAWRQSRWFQRLAASVILVGLTLFKQPENVEVVFGYPIPRAFIGIPNLVLLCAGLLWIGNLGHSVLFWSIPFRKGRHPGAVPVYTILSNGGESADIDHGFAWIQDGRLYYDGLRFSCAFSVPEATRTGLTVDAKEYGAPSDPVKGRWFRLVTGEGALGTGAISPESFLASIRRWQSDDAIPGPGILPPQDAMPSEPIAIHLGARGYAIGLIAFFGLIPVGSSVAPGWPQGVGVVLCLAIALASAFYYRTAQRIAAASDQALTESLARLRTPHEVPATVVSIPTVVHDRA